jgi:hypothetical protein
MTKDDVDKEPGISDLVMKFDQVLKKMDELYQQQKLQFINLIMY